MQDFADRLSAVQGRIARAAAASGRQPGDIELLAVSKTRSVGELEAAIACGQRLFGESYLQEALPKIEALRANALSWHFIGPIQSNKTSQIAAHFDWVHSIDRLKTARRLSRQRPPQLAPLQVCLQVNIGAEASKRGFAAGEVAAAAAAVAQLPNLTLRGLMCIPQREDDRCRQRQHFCQLRVLLDQLRGQLPGLDTLSMGMSGDLEAAIAEGATIIRIGTALFGPRPEMPAGG